jgi:hypothetical protein
LLLNICYVLNFFVPLQMNSSSDDSDENLDIYYMRATCIVEEEGQKVPYVARNLPFMTRIR